MAINERLIDTAVSGCSAEPTKEGLILHLDANDVDSYDGDGAEWIDITDHEYTPTTNVSEHFNTVTYTGNGTGQSITSLDFQPDVVWIKNRNESEHHTLFDSLSGADYSNYVNLALGQGTNEAFASFDSNGFTLDTNHNRQNELNDGYVAWCFKAGGAPSGSDKVSIDGTSYATMSAAGLTDGTIAVDKLSVNRDLGFSVIKLDNKVTHPDKTIAHGLGVSPEMIIWKRTDSTGDWYVYHKGIGEAKHIILNSQAAAVSTPDWVEATPNPTTFDVSWSSNSRDYIAYCFASKRGVSKVGSYKGNGWTTGASNKIYTGFEPAFIIGKCTSNSPSNWWIFDNKRGDEVLYPNLSDDKDLLSDYVSFDRDGFTLSDAPFVNQNGRDYIYYAVAKNTNETSLMPSKDDFTAGSVETTNLELDLDANDYSGSGDWLDGTSNSNDGTITGATYVNDGVSDYFEFGSGKHVTTTYDLPTSGGVSIELWFNANSGTTSYLAGNDNGSSDLRNQISVGNSTGAHTDESITYYQSFGNVFTGGHLIIYVREGHDKYQDGKWHHLVIVGTGSGHEVYVDGESKTFTYGTGGTQANQDILWTNFCLGKTNFNSNHYMNGKVGQCRIYETALTQAQIQSNYEATRIYNTPELELHLDAASFDGSTNTPSTWTDSSSNSNNGTITGATFDAELGNYLDFDGINDKVTTSYTTNDTDFTVEGWMKNENTFTSRYHFLCEKGYYSSSSDTQYFFLGHYAAATPAFRVRNDSTSISATSSTSLEIGKWYHYCGVKSGSNLTLYIDGQEVATQTGAPTISPAQAVTLGTNLDTYYLQGYIGQFRYYSTALTQAQIRQNYNFTKPNYPNGYDGVLGGGTTSNKPTWNSGGYFTFDGSNDYVTNNDLSLDTSKQFSFCGWVYPTADLTWQRMFSWGTSSTEVTVQKRGDNNKARFISRVSNSIKFDVDGAVLTNNQWHFIAVTGDGSDVKMYVNNNAAVTDNIAGTNNYNNLQLGTGAGTTENFDGRISKFKLYDKVLTQTEIDNLYCEGE